MFDIDVHIIRLDEPDWMLNRCLASLAGQPINIHIVQGVVEAPPLTGRRLGFEAGQAPYCSLVDPDDTVEPGAYAAMLEFAGAFDVIHGNERVLKDGKELSINTGIHHAFLVRRGIAGLDYARGNLGVINAIPRLRLSVKHLDQVFYNWNIGEGNLYNRTAEKYGVD